MYAEVVVLTYQSPEIQTYTYKVPEVLEKEIKPGQIVSVPFGKRTPLGVITSIASQPSAQVKKIKIIDSLLQKNPLLLPYQIELIKWLSSYYHAPMVNSLEAVLPPLKRMFLDSSPSTPNSLSQSVILVPSISYIPQTMAKFPQAKSHSIYHGELKAADRFAVWQKIIGANCDFIFGTRSAVFSPCPNLKEIIIYEEHDDSYKDERSPYFNTLTVAEKLQQLTGAKIRITDSSPRVSTYFSYKSEITVPKFSVKTKTVSMLDEKMSGNKTPISDLLKTYLILAVRKQKKVLLFLNKKSQSGHLYCRECKYSDFVRTALASCPNCNSHNVWFSSLNIQTLKEQVEKIVPSARINVLAEGYEKTPSIDHAIDIATASVFYKLITQKYDLTVNISPDSTLNTAELSSQEKTYEQITNLKRITKGLLLIQTYNPDNLTIQSAVKSDYAAFFQKNIEERKALNYPPFSLLIKLSAKGKKPDVMDSKAQKLFENLQQLLETLPVPVHEALTILGPYKPFFTKGETRYNILLKVRVKNYSLSQKQNVVNKIRPLLSKVPSAWQVEVEPISLN
jgi:primosomal protein N' (replication factor Y)